MTGKSDLAYDNAVTELTGAEAVKLRRDAETARSRAEERRIAADKPAAEVDQLK